VQKRVQGYLLKKWHHSTCPGRSSLPGAGHPMSLADGWGTTGTQLSQKYGFLPKNRIKMIVFFTGYLPDKVCHRQVQHFPDS